MGQPTEQMSRSKSFVLERGQLVPPFHLSQPTVGLEESRFRSIDGILIGRARFQFESHGVS